MSRVHVTNPDPANAANHKGLCDDGIEIRSLSKSGCHREVNKSYKFLTSESRDTLQALAESVQAIIESVGIIPKHTMPYVRDQLNLCMGHGRLLLLHDSRFDKSHPLQRG
jgi:hypothetical protein